MDIIELDYTLKLSRAEILALQKGLNELKTLQQKYPDERNGFDLNSQGLVDGIRSEINTTLEPPH